MPEKNPAARLSPEADKFLADACAEFDPKQDALEQNWRVSTEKHWAFNQDNGTLTVTLSDGSEWQADSQIVGSYSPTDQTWQWAWSNPNSIEAMSRDSRAVKQLGERLGISYLQKGIFPVPDPDFVGYLCAICVKATDSLGVFEAPTGGLSVFVLLKEIRWTKGLKSSRAST